MSIASSRYTVATLMKYAGREPWDSVLRASIASLLDPASAETGLSVAEISEALGQEWQGMVFGCAFEHALTLEIEPEGRNLVDEYLKRRGWTESRSNVAYLKALRESVMSLYRIKQVAPGHSMVMEDMLRGDRPVEVIEHSASQSLVEGNVIAARVLHLDGEYILSGGMLPFRAVDWPAYVLEITREWERREAQSAATSLDTRLRELAPMICARWMINGLVSSGNVELPQVVNADGEGVLFHHITFPVAKGVRVAGIARQLSETGWLVPADDDAWLWVSSEHSAPGADSETAVRVLGDVTLSQRRLVVTVNSAERAAEAIDRLQELLGDRVGTPSTLIDALDPWSEEDQDSGDGMDVDSDISIAEAERVVHAALTEHYRVTLDMSVPALGGLSPRASVESDVGRQRVEAWLRSLEEGAARGGGAIATYDFGWLWEALGLRGRNH